MASEWLGAYLAVHGVAGVGVVGATRQEPARGGAEPAAPAWTPAALRVFDALERVAEMLEIWEGEGSLQNAEAGLLDEVLSALEAARREIDGEAGGVRNLRTPPASGNVG